MKIILKKLFLLLFILNVIQLAAQTCNSPSIKSKIIYINSLGYQKQIIRGYALSDSLIYSLQKSKDTTCYNFYNLLYVKGILHIRNDKYGEALILFNELLSKLETTTYKDIEAQSYLSLALLHELMGRVQFCKENLDAAFSIIKKYDLKDALTRYYVRSASYQRVVLGQKDSCYIFAKKALESIKSTSDVKDVGDAYFLLAACSTNQSEKDSFRHKAIEIYYQSNDIISSLSLSYKVHSELVKAGKFKEALQYLENLKVKYIDALKENSLEQHSIMNYYYKEKKEEALRSKDYVKALEYGELYASNIEKMSALKNDIKISKLQEEFLFEKEQKKSQALKERSEYLSKILYVTVFVLVLMALLLYFIYSNRLKIKKQKEVIESSMAAVKELNYKNEMLLSEVHHRVKNNLQNVLSIIEIKKVRIDSVDVKDILNDISNRVNCISLIHEQLYQNEDYEKLNVYNYINKIVSLHNQITDEFLSKKFILNIDKDINLNIDSMMPIGIIVNELITNSTKHANTKSLEVIIELTRNNTANFQFKYVDNGENLETNPKTGIGKILINSMVKQLNTTFTENLIGGYNISFSFFEKTTSEV